MAVLHHVRLRGDERVVENLEEEWTERGTLKHTDTMGERTREDSVPLPVSCTD